MDGNILNFRKLYYHYFNPLKLLGVWINVTETPTKYFKMYFFVTNFFFTFSFNLAQVLNLMFQLDDLKEFAACAYVIGNACMANVKSFYLYKYRQDFSRLFEIFSDELFQPVNKEQIQIAEKSLRFYENVRKVMLMMCSITTPIAMAIPFFTRKNILNLPMAAWYPFDITPSPIYAMVYIHQCITLCYVGFVFAYTDLAMAGLTVFIGIQCDFLCNSLKIMEDTSYSDGRRTLKDCIMHHKMIINFSTTTEKLFSEIYFGQFMACTSALCMTLFLLSLQTEPTFEMFYLIFYQCSIFGLVLIPCWFSSEMHRKSENIPRAAFSCQWPSASESFKKDVIFLIHKSQKPISFHAIGLFQISVETFMKGILSAPNLASASDEIVDEEPIKTGNNIEDFEDLLESGRFVESNVEVKCH